MNQSRLCLTTLALIAGLTGCRRADDRPGAEHPPTRRTDGIGALPPAPPIDNRASAEPPSARPSGPGRPTDGRPQLEYTWRELKGMPGEPLEVAFSPDGKLIAAGAGDTIQVWATDTGEPVTRMRLPEKQFLIRPGFAADGKHLVSDGREDPVVRTWDLKTGKQVGEWRHRDPPGGGSSGSLFAAFSRDGRVMVVHFWGPKIYAGLALRDVVTGKVVTEISGRHFFRTGMDLSPDGKLLATNGDGDWLQLWDAGTGKMVRELRKGVGLSAGPFASGEFVRFSPDGRFLVARENTGVVDNFERHRAVIWGTNDGKRYALFDQFGGGYLSADNRYLLIGDGGIHDLLTDRPVPIANRGHDRHVVAVSPDTKMLAFIGLAPGSTNSRALYLTPAPVLPPPLPEKGDLTPEELGVAWGAWASTNEFARAFAGKAFAARPAQAVEFAATKVGPVTADARKRVEDMVKRLDDDSPDVRDKASAEIRGVAVEFQSLLTSVLKDAPVGEVRNRLTPVLSEVEGTKPGAGQAQRWMVNRVAGLPAGTPPPPKLAEGLRAIALLEHIGNAAAKKVLERVAAGVAGARITEEAAAALKRGEK